MIGLRIRRKAALRERPRNIRATARETSAARFAYWRTNFGVWPMRQAHQIVKHEHLAVAIGPGADADGRNSQLLGDARGHFARHRFEHHGKCAGRFHRARVALHLPRGFRRFPLHVESAERIERLRRQPDMAHHRNFRFHQLARSVRCAARRLPLSPLPRRLPSPAARALRMDSSIETWKLP